MSFVDRAAQRMERLAQGPPSALPFSVSRIPDHSSFFQNNANTLSSPPRAYVDANRSFTIASGSFDIEDDWRQTEEWLKHVPTEEEEPQLQGLFGFEFHHSHLQVGSETEEETGKPGMSSTEKGKGSQSENVVMHPANSHLVIPMPASLPANPSATPASQSLATSFQNGVFSNPSNAIGGWFRKQQADGQDSDDDMPDTDVESFYDENG